MKIRKNKDSILIALAFTSLTILFLLRGINTLHYMLGFVFFVLSITSFTYKSGVEISETKHIRNYFTLFGRSFGVWNNLPEIKHVSVIRLNQNRLKLNRRYTVQEESNNKIYPVRLIPKNNISKPIKIISASKEKALNYALEIGKVFDIQVLDYSTSEGRWIKT